MMNSKPASESAQANRSMIKGFSLLELMLCLMIISVMVLLSLPDLAVVQQTKQTHVINTLSDLLRLARTEAIRHGQRVVVCPWGNGQCGDNWSEGALLMLNSEQLVAEQWQLAPDRLSWRGFSGQQALEFSPDGSLLFQNGSFSLCPGDPSSTASQQLIINSAGRVRRVTEANIDC